MNPKEYAIKQDSYDIRAFSRVRDKSEALRKAEGKVVDKNLLNDIYASLYKVKPKLNDDIEPWVEPRKSLMENILNTSQYQSLHEKTKLDELNSALGVVSIVKTLKEDGGSDFEVLQQLIKSKRMMEGYKRLLIEGGDRMPPDKMKEISKRISDLKKVSNDLQKNLDMQKLRVVVRKGMKEASEDIERIESLSWGDEPPSIKFKDISEAMDICEKVHNSHSLREIAKLAGRLKNIAMEKQRTKAVHSRDEITDIETGDNLNRLVPSELAKLSFGPTRLLFYKDFVEKSLIQYKLEGVEKEGKGPIVVCIDQSGSMSGNRDVWAKAVTLALLHIAYKQKRMFSVITFASKVISTHVLNPRTASYKDIINILSIYPDGGTSFEAPLCESLKVIEENKSMKKADVIFITDGACKISDKFRDEFSKKKNELGFCVYGINIIGDIKHMKPFCDKVFALNSDGEDVIFDEIFSI